MGVLTGPKERDIVALLEKQSIENNNTFLVARKHNTVVSGLLKLLASKLYYIMDATVMRILAATDDAFTIINPNWTLKGDYENLDSKYIQQIPRSLVEELHVDNKANVAHISWSIDGKRETWVVDVANPGV